MNALPETAKRLREGTAGRLAVSFVSTADYNILPTLVRRYAALPKPLSYLPLVTEPLVAAVPESWIADGRLPFSGGRLSPEAVAGAPLILFPRQSAPAFHDLVTGFYAAHGRQARIVQEAIQMQTIISLVSAGMGISLVPASLRNLARTGVVYMDLGGTAPVLETGIIWRTGDATPTIERFVSIARDTIAGMRHPNGVASRRPAR